MDELKARLAAADWENVTAEINEKGFATVPGILPEAACEALIRDYPEPALYRKTVVMERYRFGLGEYRYFSYPLPGVVQALRENVYPRLVPVANNWMRLLGIDEAFPAAFGELQARCHLHKQLLPAALILKYGKGGYNTLHQDLYGEVFFPLQAVLMLNDAGKDYTGGEFVLTQQVPRAQSKAMVLRPRKGDMVLFTTNFRPVKGGRGYYRANMKHGISEVHRGERYALGIIFHDAHS